MSDSWLVGRRVTLEYGHRNRSPCRSTELLRGYQIQLNSKVAVYSKQIMMQVAANCGYVQDEQFTIDYAICRCCAVRGLVMVNILLWGCTVDKFPFVIRMVSSL